MNDPKNKKKRPPVDFVNTFGKVPPQANDIERDVLGVIITEQHTLDVVTDIIKGPEFFYKETHQRIFSAILSLRNQGSFIDIRTLVEQLKRDEQLDLVGGPYEITKLNEHVTGRAIAGIEDYCRIVAEKYMLRELIKVGGEIVQQAYEDSTDVFELIDHAEKIILGVNTETKGGFDRLDTGLVDVMKKIEDLRHSDQELTGVPTGFMYLDRLTCGWQNTDLIVLAARPSVGKTAFALNLALAAVSDKKKPTAVGFFSMEMSKTQLIHRLLSMQSEMLLEKISRGKLEDGEMKILNDLGFDPLSKLPIFIDDTPALNIYNLRSKARKMVSKYKVGIIFIDYIQLMSGMQNNRADNREQEIAKITRDLKGLAKELQIPIVALSQLSRDVEKRKDGNRMPVLSDLRESGAIEQDADIVMFMYRPEYYNDNTDEQGVLRNGETHIKFAKHRGGALDTIKLRARLQIQKFINIDTDDEGVQLGLSSTLGGNWKPVTTPAPVAKMGPYFGNTSDDDNMPF